MLNVWEMEGDLRIGLDGKEKGMPVEEGIVDGRDAGGEASIYHYHFASRGFGPEPPPILQASSAAKQ